MDGLTQSEILSKGWRKNAIVVQLLFVCNIQPRFAPKPSFSQHFHLRGEQRRKRENGNNSKRQSKHDRSALVRWEIGQIGQDVSLSISIFFHSKHLTIGREIRIAAKLPTDQKQWRWNPFSHFLNFLRCELTALHQANSHLFVFFSPSPSCEFQRSIKKYALVMCWAYMSLPFPTLWQKYGALWKF